MRWLNSKASGGHRFLLAKRILLFSVILCILVAFTPGFADDLTDPDPDWEHPWDDLDHQNPDGSNPDDPRETNDILVLQFGASDFWVIIHLRSAGQKDGFERDKAYGPTQRNRGHVLMLIK